ncbi:ATP-binding domain-containing protein [Halobium palmae]|uniref:ATP-binding domain-containing protein n=1 Tax=Halobium palmae TaxID=1776492 RepID=A0ABD5RWL3_9EURY
MSHRRPSTLAYTGDRSEFARPGETTISTVHRAKGNEAASVYVVGLDAVVAESRPRDRVQCRNEAFVALTRSRGWCTITGCDASSRTSVLDELEQVAEIVHSEDPVVTFEVPPGSLSHELEEDTENLTETSLTDFVWAEPETE